MVTKRQNPARKKAARKTPARNKPGHKTQKAKKKGAPVKATKAKKKAPVAPKAKRKGKKLVKAPALVRKTHAVAGSKKASSRAVSAKRQPQKLVRRDPLTTRDLEVNALIARVYQKAAEEMRRLEESAQNSRAEVKSHVADEASHLETVAHRMNGKN
jgi:hypothetical protein